MPLRRHALATLVVFCSALGIAPALAAKPEPTPLIPPGGPATGTPLGSVSATATECNLGVVGPPAATFGYVLPPNDAYYTLVQPGACGSCQADTRLLTVAHVVLHFTVSCEIPVTVSIVPAVDLGEGCFAPNLLAPPVCDPVEYTISDNGVTGLCVDYALPVNVSCCVDGPVFLQIEFDQGSCPNGRPMFCGPPTCSRCTQYNVYPGAPAGGDDLCAILSEKGTIMYVESTCCLPTSIAPGSWGRLKTLYR